MDFGFGVTILVLGLYLLSISFSYLGIGLLYFFFKERSNCFLVKYFFGHKSCRIQVARVD